MPTVPRHTCDDKILRSKCRSLVQQLDWLSVKTQRFAEGEGATPVQFCGGLLGEPVAPQQLPVKLPSQQQLLSALPPLRQTLPAPGPAGMLGQ